jgi:tetratricopeptide (TPR) repeat protein
MTHKRVVVVATSSLFLAGFLIAGYWTVTFAVAEYFFGLQKEPAVRSAICLVPNRAAYWAGLSEILADDKPRESLQALQKASTLADNNSAYLIELGLRAEDNGDLYSAEAYLLKAAQIDRLYLPRWSLANFYFRRGNQAQFWEWARQATAMVYGDPSPLFQLCWQMSKDGDQVHRNLNIQRPEIRIRYLSFLLGSGHVDAIAQEAMEAAKTMRPSDRDLLTAAVERLLLEKHVTDAMQLWNLLEPQLPVQTASITNANFERTPSSSGFDWRVIEFDGITVFKDEERHALRISFSGSQREFCEPLWQYLVVNPGANQVMSIAAELEAIPPKSGLVWQVINAANETILATSVSSELRFTVPPDCRLVRVVLIYRRAPGQRRIEGDLYLKQVKLSS